jgi:hypothetical protein
MEAVDQGFYYMVFQPDPRRESVRCWIDGSDDARLLFFDEMRQMIDLDLRPAFEKAFREVAFFLWSVEERSLRRVSFKGEKIPITDWIRQKKTEGQPEQESSVDDIDFWNVQHSGTGEVKVFSKQQ